MTIGVPQQIFRLETFIQKYGWGQPAPVSLVYVLSRNASGGVPAKVDGNEPHAELWVGNHPSGPNKVALNTEGGSLEMGEFFRKYPETLGESLKPSGDLPYLLKILSVVKPLSIQTHPDKKLAEKLHTEQPSIYKDPNHKPEMTIALTPFEALCGFRPLDEVMECIRCVPEFAQIVGSPHAEAAQKGRPYPESDSETLRKIFASVMTKEEGAFKSALTEMVSRFEKTESEGRMDSESMKEEYRLCLRLHREFPFDVGVFAPFLLTKHVLKPGEALFTGANTLHAYLFGDCVEVMACSDNVIRGGLTPKFKDVDLLLQCLRYDSRGAQRISGKPLASQANDASFQVLEAPESANVTDFRIVKVEVEAGGKREGVVMSKGGAVVGLVVQGYGKVSSSASSLSLPTGCAFLVPAGVSLSFEAEGEATTNGRNSPFLYSQPYDGKEHLSRLEGLIQMGGFSASAAERVKGEYERLQKFLPVGGMNGGAPSGGLPLVVYCVSVGGTDIVWQHRGIAIFLYWTLVVKFLPRLASLLTGFGLPPLELVQPNPQQFFIGDGSPRFVLCAWIRTVMKKCKRHGCQKEYTDDDNHDTACAYHPGWPVFHDLKKSWSCCQTVAWDWDEFMKLPTCARGKHTEEKPQRVPAPSSAENRQAGPAAFQTPSYPVKTIDEYNREQREKEAEIKRKEEEQQQQAKKKPFVTPGGMHKCCRAGCNKEYDPEKNHEDVCSFHPGKPCFRDIKKWWTCCNGTAWDWDEFTALPTCAKGKHDPKMVNA
uniref:mannose-6-phosphate isomerase n=1 Tax=Chromera velia CCMP2878 TaxID=1169474 RepID=A0A0G4IB03_9ALVE|eukprot:Cvel_12606.t1-p1 / transcript=Cvel_12606.t1 / gene=Cvel_12606 / organism=Chromera_velia_CCMP2878 / gene_product=Mannose-6-phosphate isomerase, putative / transcript_product=Mannose-6-phosphate isomerase, putative / location=Cvel_scaffold832:4830-8494(-) / protein_length=767 / sequence_SO=supercontig / SO=protein_coding / is_pseudo=false